VLRDLVFVAIVIAFFVLAAGALRLCERAVKEDGQP
jgi:hypothetical protein